MYRTTIAVRFWAAVVTLIFGVGLAHADGIKGVQLARQDAGQERLVFQNSDFWGSLLKNAWTANQGNIDRIIEQRLPELNPKLPKKVGVHDQHSHVSGNCTVLESTFANNQVHVRMLIKGNHLTFETTTDTIFGSYADPKFELDYDLELTVVVQIPTKAEPLRATSVVAKIGSFRWSTKNVLVAIIDFFKGTDFITNSIKGQKVDLTNQINNQLDPLNREITKLKHLGLNSLNASVDPKTRQLRLTIDRPHPTAMEKAKQIGKEQAAKATQSPVKP